MLSCIDHRVNGNGEGGPIIQSSSSYQGGRKCKSIASCIYTFHWYCTMYGQHLIHYVIACNLPCLQYVLYRDEVYNYDITGVIDDVCVVFPITSLVLHYSK